MEFRRYLRHGIPAYGLAREGRGAGKEYPGIRDQDQILRSVGWPLEVP
jgi:hypothetical protein